MATFPGCWYLLKMYLDDQLRTWKHKQAPDEIMHEMLQPAQLVLYGTHAGGILEEFNTTLARFNSVLDMPEVDWVIQYENEGKVNLDRMCLEEKLARWLRRGSSAYCCTSMLPTYSASWHGHVASKSQGPAEQVGRPPAKNKMQFGCRGGDILTRVARFRPVYACDLEEPGWVGPTTRYCNPSHFAPCRFRFMCHGRFALADCI